MAAALPVQMIRGKTISKAPFEIAANMGNYGVTDPTDATVTCTPSSGKKAGVAWIDYGYRAAPSATASIKISDGVTTWGPFNVSPTSIGLQTRVFDPPLMFSKDATVTVTLLHDGAAVKDLFAMFVEEGPAMGYA